MRLNGAGSHRESSGSSAEVDDMIETENEGLRERVSDLERKVLEQGDELVCLRSTLADVLRRLNQFESRGDRPLADRTVVNGQRLRYQDKEGVRRVVSHQPSALPQRQRVHYQSTNSLHSDSHSSNSVSPIPTSPSPTHTPPPLQPARTPARPNQVATSREGARTPTNQQPSLREVSRQDNGSRSGSTRDVRDGARTPTNQPYEAPREVSRSASSQGPSREGSRVGSNLYTAKRWSSTGDFNQTAQSPTVNQSPMMPTSRLATKSLLNLYMRPQQPIHGLLKHGTRDSSWNGEDGTLRMYMRGRPIVLYAPTELMDRYDMGKVATPPPQRLKLDWVYGYRGKDARSNLYLLPTGELVYFIAAVVVLHNVDEQAQRHYLGHTDDVKCMSVHPNKLLVATGQVAGHSDARPHVRVWNSVSLATVSVIGLGDFERSICCVSFSKADGGVLLCAVDEASDHNISVWDWQKGDRGLKITETKCSGDTVVACEFHPLDRQAIVTCGKAHINFWTLDSNGTLYKRMGVFENRDRPKYVTSLAFTQTGDAISGDSNGNLIVWGRGTNTIARMVRGVHEGSIFSVCALKDGSLVTGGGKDGRLVQLDSRLAPTGAQAHIPEHFGMVRTVSEGRGSQLLVGTTRNSILIGSLTLGFSPTVLGHTDEVWALASHPSLPQFVTAGWDKLLHLWDSMSHSVVWSKDLPEPVQSACFSQDGQVLVVGCVNGRWIVMDSETREVYSMHQDGGEPIQTIRFSPDGNQIALGSRDNNIYVYQTGESARKYNRVGRCMGHSSFITHLDWSSDGQFIRSNSGDYELLFWNASLCRQIPHPSQMRDVDWATNSCVLTFKTLGIWPENADGTDVNSCDRSADQHLIATADDFGKVKLYSYPCTQPKSLCHTYGGHSSHVTGVRFLHDDSRLISTGGRDTSVLQWSIT